MEPGLIHVVINKLLRMKFKLTGGVQLFSRVSIVACSVFSSCKQILWLPKFYSLHTLLEVHCLLQIHSPICLILSKHSDELPILVSGPELKLIFVLSLVVTAFLLFVEQFSGLIQGLYFKSQT